MFKQDINDDFERRLIERVKKEKERESQKYQNLNVYIKQQEEIEKKKKEEERKRKEEEERKKKEEEERKRKEEEEKRRKEEEEKRRKEEEEKRKREEEEKRKRELERKRKEEEEKRRKEEEERRRLELEEKNRKKIELEERKRKEQERMNELLGYQSNNNIEIVNEPKPVSYPTLTFANNLNTLKKKDLSKSNQNEISNQSEPVFSNEKIQTTYIKLVSMKIEKDLALFASEAQSGDFDEANKSVQLICQMKSFGFDIKKAKETILLIGNDIHKCLDHLTKNN